jgi:hypothetical protein
MMVAAAVFCLALLGADSASPHNAFTPNQVQYGPPSPFIPPGAQVAVLEGDPSASSGDFTIRAKLPGGYKFPPNWHPQRENVTVISGNFKVGMGDKFDESKMMNFGPGSFAYLGSGDASLRHERRRDHRPSPRSRAADVQLCQS